MQELINVCLEYCKKCCLEFNVKKTKCMVLDKKNRKFYNIAPLYINDSAIDYVNEWIYLGTCIVSGDQFAFSASSDLKAF